MRKPLTLLTVAALGLAMLGAGCGGDDDETTVATGTTGATGATGAAGGEPLSKQEFIKQADAICAKGDDEINREGNQAFQGEPPSTEEQEQFATDTVIPNIQNQVDQIRTLTPPEGDEDEVNAILDAAQEGIDKLEEDPSLIAEGGAAGGTFEEANRLAQDYGLRDCGGG
jgi:hypothetical protein